MLQHIWMVRMHERFHFSSIGNRMKIIDIIVHIIVVAERLIVGPDIFIAILGRGKVIHPAGHNLADFVKVRIHDTVTVHAAHGKHRTQQIKIVAPSEICLKPLIANLLEVVLPDAI